MKNYRTSQTRTDLKSNHPAHKSAHRPSRETQRTTGKRVSLLSATFSLLAFNRS